MRVFVDYNPWDTGTRREPGSDAAEVAELAAKLGVDGVFLDTLKEGAGALRAALDAVRPGLVLEGESRVPLARIDDHAMSWAQWFADSAVPGVLRAKWFERRHMLHHTRRWHRDHLDELHSAWLNGAGVLVWESVFGVWVGWNERDRAVLRAMRRVQREPRRLVAVRGLDAARRPPRRQPGVRVPLGRTTTAPLWTVVNRGADHDGPWLVTEARPAALVDLVTGAGADRQSVGDGRVAVGGPLPAGRDRRRATVDRRRLSQPHEPPSGRPVVPGPRRRAAPHAAGRPLPDAPAGMVAVAGGRRELTVRYRVRETGLYGEAPYVDEWKPLPPRLHHTATLRRTVDLGRFAIADARGDPRPSTPRSSAPPATGRRARSGSTAGPGPAGRAGHRRRPRRRPGLRGVGRAAAADRGRVAGGRCGGAARAAGAAGVEPDRERAHATGAPGS